MSGEISEFDSHLERLIQKEKTARINNEHFVSVTILKDIITLCYNSKNWTKLQQQITYLMNRRGQSKKAQIQMIQLAMTWLPTLEEPFRTQLIQTIRDVCAKKIFLQVEYARCVLLIVKSKESDNDILEAAKILQEVQVQTYGSMDKREKLQFILYQMKIMIKKKDFVRLFIISKKINQNNINDDEIADIKILFYSYMLVYQIEQKNFAQCARCYKLIWQTLKSTKKIIPQTLDFGFKCGVTNVLSNYIGFLALQPYSDENKKEMDRLAGLEELERYEAIIEILNAFLSKEIVNCDVQSYKAIQFQLFSEGFTHSQEHKAELKRMLVQHNVRVISQSYGRITIERVSQLIGVEKEYCQEQLCTLNNKKVISCRIDRIDDVIDFRPIENQGYLLQGWNSSINQILDLVEVASNLIHRERQVYKK